ncbi:peroxidasin [Arctopsyche grandis]|uniref:peroxidasin n=1 Tax=Arctopsyche grandis TaxID=121162 RepID=UPI00406D9456
MAKWSWSCWLTVVMLVISWSAPASACPKGCVCVRRTVRCMHLQMDSVPLVSPDTTILDLRFNKIRDIPPGAFSNLKHLTTLLLNNNHLTMLRANTFEGLFNLRYLYLYKNRIHHIDDDAFKGLKNLQQLYLHYNEISAFNEEVFSHVQNLERLFLQNNKIHKLPKRVFDHLKSLQRLRLDSNLLICDCSILWLLQMINEKNSNGKNLQATATCQNPEDMRGVSLISMALSDLHCAKPSIKNGPKDVEVSFGGTALFTCQVSGDPTPEILWMKNSNEIPFSDPKYQILEDGSLKIDNSDESDLGVFECMAKNPLGEVKSNEARIHMQEPAYSIVPPQFSILPNSKTVRFNDKSVRLDCLAKGKPHPHITWYHNEQRMILSDKIKLYRNGSINILKIDGENTGTYRCEAENIHGKIFATASLKVYQPPIISMTYAPLNYTHGDQLTILCDVHGLPTPVVTWFRNGVAVSPNRRIYIETNQLQISPLDTVDTGNYMCRAENSEGFKEKSITITVRQPIRELPELIFKPYDVESLTGSTIELPCRGKGNPPPQIQWKKDGTNLFRTIRHRVSQTGNLYIANVTQEDNGRYECTLVNENGRVTASGVVTIKEDDSPTQPGNPFVRIAFAEAVQEVDSAINRTVESLFGDRDARPNMGDLYRIVRFPNAPQRELARAAEVYERTLTNIRRHVNLGKNVSITSNFNYKELLSPEHLSLVAKLSGCTSHRIENNCTNVCFHSKYRSIDGTCNNLEHPTWGASNIGFRRILKPIYENGFSQPVGWSKDMKYNGYTLPSARLVSSKLISTTKVTPDSRISHMVMQWGQFLDHDMDHATPSVTSQSWDGIDCKRSCDYAAPCFPIDIPQNDPRVSNRRCIDFIRSSSVCGSGMTSVFFNEVQPREQINQLTTFIDASQVYGYDENIAEDLRNLTTDDGLLREGVTFPGKKALLPYSSGAQEMDCRRGALESDIKCFIAGDIRANEQVGLLSMHTLWFREHNRIAIELKSLNPHWSGDVLYHESRKIVGAQMQHITYNHWLPIILGPSGIDKLNSGTRQYDPNVNPTISNVFATAALRFGHSLINPILHRFDNDFNEISEGHLPLHKAFFASWRVVEEGGIDPLLRGLFAVPAKLKTPGENLNSDLTEKLFQVAHAVALDLAAMNIQRSRDHAIPPYTEWRRVCNMSQVETFDDLSQEISDAGMRRKLQELYGSVHNIDVWVGGILEDQVEGAKVGPLFQCLLVEQFRRLRDGDRFWYENPGIFKREQLNQIRQTTLARVLCDNGDDMDLVSEDVFLLPEVQEGLIECYEVPKMDMRHWADCSDCDGGFCGSSSTFNAIRTRRHLSKRDLSNKNTVQNMIGYSKAFDEMKDSMKSMKRRIENLEKNCILSGLDEQSKNDEN